MEDTEFQTSGSVLKPTLVFFFNQQQNLAAEEHTTTFFQHMLKRYQGDLNFEHMDILESSSFCTSDM